MTLLITVVAIAGLVGALHLLMVWFEARGWVYYRRSGAPMGVAAQNALSEFEAVLNPSAEYLIEERRLGGLRSQATGQGFGDDDPEWFIPSDRL